MVLRHSSQWRATLDRANAKRTSLLMLYLWRTSFTILFYPPPADNAGLCPDGGLCRPSCCSPFVDQVLGPKAHMGEGKNKKNNRIRKASSLSLSLRLDSEKPRGLLLSLGGAIQTLTWVLSWACPGPIPGPRWSRPDSPCALFSSFWDPSRSRGGGHPGPSWSHPAPERSFQDRPGRAETDFLATSD